MLLCKSLGMAGASPDLVMTSEGVSVPIELKCPSPWAEFPGRRDGTTVSLASIYT